MLNYPRTSSVRAVENRAITENIVLHHSASRQDATAESIAKYHINTLGYAAAGYHFMIENDGKIYAGRPIKAIGAHTLMGYNFNSIGICLIGNFDIDVPSEAQIISLKQLVTEITELYPDIQLTRHEQLDATNCPGRNTPEWSEIMKQTTTDGNWWSKAAREYCISEGIFVGDNNANFNWSSPITREEVAVIIHRILSK